MQPSIMSLPLPTCFLIFTFFLASFGLQQNSTTITPNAPLNSTVPSTTVSPPQVNVSSKANSTNSTENSASNSKAGIEEAVIFSFFKKNTAIGYSCKTTDDCDIKEAFCINGTCQCSTEYVPSFDKRRCLIRAKSLLDPCIEDVQCEVGLNATGLTSCIAFRCICDVDTILVHGRCYKRVELGGKCEHNYECSVPFSTCIQNVCACNTNFEPHEDNDRCVLMESIAAASTNCTDDHMCSVFGELYVCRNYTCECKPGFHFSGRKCIAESRLGDYCEHNDDCKVDIAVEKSGIRECRNNACSCIEGYVTDKQINLCKNSGSLIAANILVFSFLWLLKLL